ncbi:hypothetical protein [Nitrosomonas communis]|uniref:hypothetical protein n=1 Tax=Nitrosomonas communis TaxID=44574 RepID=UPI0015A6E60C|nr:hypothetical protein [Nitrosomonas communis]
MARIPPHIKQRFAAVPTELLLSIGRNPMAASTGGGNWQMRHKIAQGGADGSDDG